MSLNQNFTHYTELSPEEFRYEIVASFIDAIEDYMDEHGLSQKQLAERLGVSKGRVTQMLRYDQNPRLETMIRVSRALGLKLTVFPYDDGDPGNDRGPVPPSVFVECWRRAGSPPTWMGLEDSVAHGHAKEQTMLVSEHVSAIDAERPKQKRSWSSPRNHDDVFSAALS